MAEVDAVQPPDVEAWLARLRWTALVVPVVFVVALPVVTTLVMEPRWPHRGHLVTAAVAAVAVACFGLWMVYLISRGYQQVQALQHRALQAERHSAVLEERDRIAREMHDSLAQVLAVAHLRLRGIQGDPSLGEQARAEVTDLADLCQESCRDVREAILGLREDSRGSGGLAEQLARYLAAFRRNSGMQTTLDCSPEHPVLPEEQRLQLSRVVQEALTNARKHSGASRVDVGITTGGGLTRVVVADDGIGFDPAARRDESYGLHTMRERVEQLGGRLQVDSAPGRGTRVVAELPLLPAPVPQESTR